MFQKQATCDCCGKSIAGNSGTMVFGVTYCHECYETIKSINENADSKTLAAGKRYLDAIGDRATDAAKKEILKCYKAIEKRSGELNQEKEKVSYAQSFNEYYEYDVVTVINANHGTVDKERLRSILTGYAQNGWRLHTIYSNELGKNAIQILGFGVNETACEDVLIFERRIPDNSFR